MHATSRSFVAAARTHPAGIAAPSAVIVTAIILFTLVTSVIVPSIRPGLFGIGSAPAISPSPDHTRHRVQPQPVLTGPPILPALTGSLGGSTPSTSGGTVPSPVGGGQPPVAPSPPTVSGFPPGTVPAPVVSRHLPAPSAAGCPACCGGQAAGSAVVTVVAGAGNAVHAVTQVVTSESVIPAVTSGLAATTGSVVRAAGTVTSGVTSTVTSVASATAAAAPVTAAVAPVAAATAASAAGTAGTAVGQAPSGAATTVVDVADQVNHRRSAESASEQAGPGAGTLPGVG